MAMPASLAECYAHVFAESQRRYDHARQLFPDGVTHDVRHMLPFPVYVERAAGAYKWTIEGRQLVDYFCGHGSLLLGHCYPAVVEAVQRQVARGTHLGSCHELELQWADWIRKLIPSAERVRFVASGTEATLMAFRLARIFTGRKRILKFAGHFHGWHDAASPGAGPPYDDHTVPGVPLEVSSQTVVAMPNDLNALELILKASADIAAVVLEPTGGHWGSVPINGDYLRGLRELTARLGVLLIFDEVITGFRVAPGGAQSLYGVMPDMTTLAKVLAGGLPGGCVAGRTDILAAITNRPGQPRMRHPGTYNGNPLSAVAGIATLSQVASGEPCTSANRLGTLLRQKLNEMFEAEGAAWVAYGEHSMFHLIPDYAGPRPTDDSFVPYAGDLLRIEAFRDIGQMHAFRQALLLAGVDMPGYGGWLSAMHTEADIDTTVQAVQRALRTMPATGT